MIRLSGLDALRGVAAIMVALLHVNHSAGDAGLFSAAYLAVDLFFMISGYVLARTFDRRLGFDLSAVGFFLLRLRRLWPVMAIGALLGLFSFARETSWSPAIWMTVLALGFIPQAIRPGLPAFPANPPTWSILVELAANALHALILVRLSNRSLASIAVACLALLMLLSSDVNKGILADELGLAMLRIGFSYTVGMLLWRVAGDRPRLSPALALAAFPALVMIGSYFAGWYDFVFVAVVCPLILLGCLGESRLGPYLGPLSFPLYAVHYPVGNLVIDRGGSMWLAFIAALAVAAICAFFLEPRGRSWASPLLGIGRMLMAGRISAPDGTA